jgi:hypothetical protein
MLSHNYDSRGRRVNPQGGHYMIPADQFLSVVARAQWDPRILNCFPFLPLAPSSPCPPTPAPSRAPGGVPPPIRFPIVRRR